MSATVSAIGRSSFGAAALLLFLDAAAAQVPPTMPPPMVPHPNPSSSLVVPQAPEVPVSPATPGPAPGSNLAGTNEVVNSPHSVFQARYRRHRDRVQY